MSLLFKRLKGFADIYGPMRESFFKMETQARQVFGLFGFEELRTPILEQTALFQRSIGSATDVVQKEMFSFTDSKDRSMTLRPEATAGVMRACIENGLVNIGTVSRFFTIGPMFRHERPQKGRMRQFHQINCESLGSDSPYADAELICMLLDFLRRLNLSSLTLKMNSLGCGECRNNYLDKLRAFFAGVEKEKFCPDCQARISTNPLRVLDCKNEACRQILVSAPLLLDNVCDECKIHFQTVLKLLDLSGVQVEIDHHLVRGLDYYIRTTFEVASNDIGAQTAVAGGGRYDGLISQLGGPDIPGVGFACGMERLALLMKESSPQTLDFYFIAPENEQREKAFLLVSELRKNGFSGEMNYDKGGFKSLMRQASKSGAKFCIILGQDEAQSNSVSIKNMRDGSQNLVEQSELVACFANYLAKLG